MSTDYFEVEAPSAAEAEKLVEAGRKLHSLGKITWTSEGDPEYRRSVRRTLHEEDATVAMPVAA
jgi:hypothetical protein